MWKKKKKKKKEVNTFFPPPNAYLFFNFIYKFLMWVALKNQRMPWWLHLELHGIINECKKEKNTNVISVREIIGASVLNLAGVAAATTVLFQKIFNRE